MTKEIDGLIKVEPAGFPAALRGAKSRKQLVLPYHRSDGLLTGRSGKIR